MLSVTMPGPMADAAQVGQLIPGSTKFVVVDQVDRGAFSYAASGGYLERTSLSQADARPRGIASNAAGDRKWVIDAAKGPGPNVFVYDAQGQVIGSWRARGVVRPEGITTDGTNVWIVDRVTDRVFFYANAASYLSAENAWPTSSFRLNRANTSPSDLVTDGTKLWVVNDQDHRDAVFVYSTAGSLLGQWSLDSTHSGIHSPSGITLNPSGGDDLWIVDRHTDRVYDYPGGRDWLDGAHLPGSSFALDPANAHPEGIADPDYYFSITVREDSDPVSADMVAYVPELAIPGVEVSVSDNTNSGLVSADIDGTVLTLTFTPDESGEAVITIAATLGQTVVGHGYLTVTVTPNTPPVAVNDSYSTKHDTQLAATAPGVKVNDYDADGDAITAILVSGPSHAAASGFHFHADGSFDYTPAAHYAGTDTFTYKVNDGHDDGNTATVTINVWNHAPVAVNDAVSIRHDTQGLVSAPGVKANDSDPDGDALTAILVNGPSHAAAFHLNADGSADYTPAAHFAGTDTFTYKVNDGVADSNTATVTITVWNNAPVANNDGAYWLSGDGPLTVAAQSGVLANDSDPDGDTLTAQLATQPSHGTVSLNSSGAFVYTPDDNTSGTDSFTYVATDGIVTSAPAATVTIYVAPPSISMEINGSGSGDDYVKMGGSGGTLTVTMLGGVASETYRVHLSDISGHVTFSTSDISLHGQGGGLGISLNGVSPGLFTITATCSAASPTSATESGTAVRAQLKSIEFLSDHGVLKKNPTSGSVWGDSSTPFETPEWVANPARNNPISQTKHTFLTVISTIQVEPAGVSVDVGGSSADPYATFSTFMSLSSTGADQSINTVANSPLPDEVGILTVPIDWTIKIGSVEVCNVESGPHTIYVTYGTPIGTGPTEKRMEWACGIAQGAATITDAAETFRDGIASSPGYAQDPQTNDWNLNSWEFLASGHHGDCITLAALACAGLSVTGIPADYRWAYPTADGTAGFPAVSGNSCHTVTTTVFQYQGQTFNAKLIYPGNNFEGFFTVSDPGIEAYTIYTPGGPFTNQTYYYLQVLQFAAGQGGDQFWVWDGTQTKNGVTVTDWDEVPGAAHIPVPGIPSP